MTILIWANIIILKNCTIEKTEINLLSFKIFFWSNYKILALLAI